MKHEKDDLVLIFRPYTTINGQRVYARQKGKKAFPMLVPREPRKPRLKNG